jgi:hypothetical protein
VRASWTCNWNAIRQNDYEHKRRAATVRARVNGGGKKESWRGYIIDKKGSLTTNKASIVTDNEECLILSLLLPA